MRERLDAYHAKQKRYPEHILFYRDGVSESQFGMVRDKELPQIRDALKEKKINAKITFVIVGKRHHARFYPVNDRDVVQRENLQSGSIVSSGVTPPRQFSFYLQSHDSPIGTARTAHYVVLENESNYGADELKKVVSCSHPSTLPYSLTCFINRRTISASQALVLCMHCPCVRRLDTRIFCAIVSDATFILPWI